jgi:hypothetical protein
VSLLLLPRRERPERESDGSLERGPQISEELLVEDEIHREDQCLLDDR